MMRRHRTVDRGAGEGGIFEDGRQGKKEDPERMMVTGSRSDRAEDGRLIMGKMERARDRDREEGVKGRGRRHDLQ